jgi:RNA polymerase sigma factor (sigma-70 family)
MAYRGISRLTADEERALGLRIRAGDDDAWRELVSRCVPLVFSYVRRVSWGPGVDPDDMAQQGILGLMKAARRYDPDGHPGYRFSSYAIYAIRNSIAEARRRREMSSLPDRDCCEDPGPAPHAHAELADDLAGMRRAVARLRVRTRRVIEWRFFKDETLEKVGRKLGVSKQRVEQIEREALAEMRAMMGVEMRKGGRSCPTSGRSAAAAGTASRRLNSSSRRAIG